LDGEVDEHQFTRIASADVQALQEKVEVQFQPRRLPAGPCPTEMTITLRDGRVFSNSRLHPKGSPANPLSDEELVGLFCKWAGPDLPARQQIIEIVSSLETSRDVRDLTRLLHIAAP
jgi:2-methylcitrate dehydratase PrpD